MPAREPCCEIFASACAGPEAFFAGRTGIDLSRLGQTRQGAPLTTTARGLLLRRDGLIQHGSEQVLGPAGWGLAPWHHDSYAGGLGLLDCCLEVLRHERILDVGSGLGIFPTEASILGAQLDAVDDEIDDHHPSFVEAGQWFASHYGEQIALLRCLGQHARLPRYVIEGPMATVLERLYRERAAIATAYPSVSGRRIVDDARSLARIDSATYDRVLCGWVMAHLTEQDERRALSALVRVVAPGGTLHVKAGWGADAASRYGDWLGPGRQLVGRTVAIDAASTGDLIVLRVG